MNLLNYTQRTDIYEDSYSIEVLENIDTSIYCRLILDLAIYDFNPNSKIFLEAYSKQKFMRLDCGTILNNEEIDSANLFEFSSNDVIQFRIKVIDMATFKIEGMANRCKFFKQEPQKNESQQQSLLPIKQMELDGAPWAVMFDEELPYLAIDTQISKTLVKTDKKLNATILSGSFREILTRILFVENQNHINFDVSFDSQNDWREQWLLFCSSIDRKFDPEEVLNKDSEEDEATRKTKWINDTVSCFCKKHSLCENLIAQIEGIES